MRLALAVVLLGCTQPRPPAKEEPNVYADAAPLAVVPPPVLPPVEGATTEAGAEIFARACAPCHGAEGKGDGPRAAELARAPTDLTGESFLCRGTVGPRAMPSDADLNATLDLGSHRGLPALAPGARRAALLHVKTLSPGFARPPLPVLAVPPETADTPADRERGRVLYYAVGCWRCHGPTGDGDGDFVRELAWNGRALGKLRPLSEAGGLCGEDRLYVTLALGLGSAPAIMPRHQELLELLSRPRDGGPAVWTRSLEGRLPAADVLAVQRFLAALPARKDTLAMDTATRRARGASFTWSLVHWLRSR